MEESQSIIMGSIKLQYKCAGILLLYCLLLGPHCYWQAETVSNLKFIVSPLLFIIVVAILSTKINICMVTNNKISDHGDLAQYKWMEMNSSAADEDEELQFYTNRKNSSNLSLHIFSCIIICCQIHEDSLFMLIFMMNEFLGLRL